MPEPTTHPLMPRADCPASMFQCPASLGAAFSDVCCSDGQTCALDHNNSPACCPSGAVCTGAAPTGQPSVTQAVSYVPNSYFSFPYAMTTFDNSADCRSAVVACSENYDLCTSNLGGDGGSGYGVTVDVPGGGGVTVGASATDLGASATSVCSSLSSEACSPLAATDCSIFGEGAAVSSMDLFMAVRTSFVLAISVALVLG
ncbi:hypothetical protein GMORB2_7382 [Geosmithia morbida]|uniref:Uncharacterized protein n=1 Tax=Geosmithia morbida TaxID=1094350 RepID=A0A9P5D426_9HYPO|nr:uncharacterized protein GMORB2_7382 [Geosmithia morbida]KAF4122390.1 hypothetical protein GMORB2_7382 [Geosmithia morbida]